ncbi:MAG: Four helix bundle sensory module for signal transduction [Bacteroidetes bacterium OLB12]|nr:MAG: Four helix bundle sensory module for signal transduction [Bacteroidetes bacterium OLB12]HNR73178.1 MCP four helix bundle domain-containing protein [Cyclobacteriaceae bacterium]HNU40844.1 MCP four helix bundle domain-containing protein [Cyclobacteriaceae bacterium]
MTDHANLRIQAFVEITPGQICQVWNDTPYGVLNIYYITNMKWAYSIQNKLAASATLFVLCLLVLFSNYQDQKHTDNVKNSISTLYADRLVVEDYILKITIDIYEIKQILSASGGSPENIANQIEASLQHIEGLTTAYQKTKLTKAEDEKFTLLLKTLTEFESSDESISRLSLANKALVLLNELSTIQLEESKLIMRQAENLYKSGKVASQFAFALTIIILLILQALVFTSKTLKTSANASTTNLN